MLRRRTFVAWLLGGAVVIGSVAACYGPTQVTLQITTDIACPGLDTAIYVNDEATPRAVTSDCTAPSGTRIDNLIGTLALAPNGSRDESLAVEVIVGAGASSTACHDQEAQGKPLPSQCVVARRTLVFSPHDSLVLPIRLYRDCLGVTCTDGATCSGGVCVTSSCSGEACISDPPPKKPDPEDASTPDAPPPPDDGGSNTDHRPCVGGNEILVPDIPEPGASTISIPTLAGNDSKLFWVDGTTGATNSAVMSVPVTGGVPTPVSSTDLAQKTAVIVASNHYLWWYNASKVRELDLTAPTPVVLPISVTNTSTLAYASGATNTLFIASETAQGPPPTYDILSHKPGDLGPVAVLGTAQGADKLVAANASYVFVVTPDNFIHRYKIGSTTIEMAIEGPPSIKAIVATADSSLYMSTSPGGAGATGQGIRVLLENQQIVDPSFAAANQPRAIATDGGHVYIVEHPTGSYQVSIVSRVLAGTAVPIATGFTKISNVVVDAKCIYFWGARETGGTGIGSALTTTNIYAYLK